jgi:hypothetical protein
MIWMSVENQVPTLHYADRNAVTDAFGPSQTLAATTDYYALDRVAVSPDGLRFVVVRSDRKGFGEFTRSARLHDFTTVPNEVSFSRINGLGKMLPAQELLGDPIVSADDLSFYFSRYGGDAPGTIYEATRTGPVTWPIGAAVAGKVLQVVGTSRRRPTGVSVDRRTLFYWDEASGTERAAWRPALNWQFNSTKDLGARAEAQPNATCTKLYFSSDGAGGSDVFVAPGN